MALEEDAKSSWVEIGLARWGFSATGGGGEERLRALFFGLFCGFLGRDWREKEEGAQGKSFEAHVFCMVFAEKIEGLYKY